MIEEIIKERIRSTYFHTTNLVKEPWHIEDFSNLPEYTCREALWLLWRNYRYPSSSQYNLDTKIAHCWSTINARPWQVSLYFSAGRERLVFMIPPIKLTQACSSSAWTQWTLFWSAKFTMLRTGASLALHISRAFSGSFTFHGWCALRIVRARTVLKKSLTRKSVNRSCRGSNLKSQKWLTMPMLGLYSWATFGSL